MTSCKVTRNRFSVEHRDFRYLQRFSSLRDSTANWSVPKNRSLQDSLGGPGLRVDCVRTLVLGLNFSTFKTYLRVFRKILSVFLFIHMVKQFFPHTMYPTCRSCSESVLINPALSKAAPCLLEGSFFLLFGRYTSRYYCIIAAYRM